MSLLSHGEIGSPVAIELVGLPGSGKSSLCTILADPSGRRMTQVRLRDEVGCTAVLRNAVGTAWPFMGQARYLSTRRWRRYRAMVLLGCYRAALDELRGRCAVAVLDQGPVFLLSTLQHALQEPRELNASPFLRYWSDQMESWARALRLVAVLDAPDEVLHDRIQRRGIPHPLVGCSLDMASRSFAKARRERERILEQMLMQTGSPDVIEIRSDTVTPEAAADSIAARLGLDPARSTGYVAPCLTHSNPRGRERDSERPRSVY